MGSILTGSSGIDAKSRVPSLQTLNGDAGSSPAVRHGYAAPYLTFSQFSNLIPDANKRSYFTANEEIVVRIHSRPLMGG